MARSYSSFVVRCWRLDDGEQRIEVEHLQSGERTSVTSLSSVLEWIDAHAPRPEAEGGPDRERASR